MVERDEAGPLRQACDSSQVMAGTSRHADTLDRMVSGNEIPRDPQVPAFLADRPPLLRCLDGHGRVHDVPAVLDQDALHVEIPEHVRDESIRLIRVLDDVDVPVHEPLQLRDVLALLPDRLADVPFLDDEDQLVAGVHAIDDGRPGQVLEKRDVLDRLLVKDNLGHAAQALRMFDSPGLRTATAATENGTPQAAPRSTFVPGNRKVRMSPRARAASGGQFEARTTILALFAFAARRTSRSPNRTSPVSVATRRARETSITGRPLRSVPRAPPLPLARRPAMAEPAPAPARASASRPRTASAARRAAGRWGSPRRF